MYIFIIRSCIPYFISLPHCMYFWIFECYHIYFYVNCVANSTAIEISGNRSTRPIASTGTQCVLQLPVWSHIHIYAHIYLFAYLMFSYIYPVCMHSVCINVKTAISGPQKLGCFQQWWFKTGSTRMCYGVTCLLTDWSASLSLIVCKFQVCASRLVVGA